MSLPKPFHFILIGIYLKLIFTSIYLQMQMFSKFSLNRQCLSYPPINRAYGMRDLIKTLYCYLVAAYTHLKREIRILQGLSRKIP